MKAISELLFVDCETVPQYEFERVPDHVRHLYIKKFNHEIILEKVIEPDGTVVPLSLGEQGKMHYTKKAGLYAEFGRIVCISIGLLVPVKEQDQPGTFFIKAYCDQDEKRLLEAFVNGLTQSAKVGIIAHNGLNFDYPYLVRRLWAHGIPVPHLLNTLFKKTWDLALYDTMAMWKVTSYKDTASLDLICHTLGIPSPKSGVDGSMVAEMFKAGKLEAIANYCNGDILALLRVYARLTGQSVPEKINIIPFKPVPVPAPAPAQEVLPN